MKTDIALVPAFNEALRVWLKIGLLSFGGPAGQIALMHQLVVDERRWISESRFLHALNYCMLLPGPEAQQLATYIGWLLHGIRGGLAAGVLFVLPGAIVMLALSIVYVLYHDVALLTGLFLGVKTAVLVIVLQALHRIAKKILINRSMFLIATAAFVGIFVFDLPFPLIVFCAGLVGALGARWDESRFVVVRGHEVEDSTLTLTHHSPSAGRAFVIVLVGGLLWFTPIALAAWLLGPDHAFVDAGLFFSKLAVVTFGGAYAVLAYMAQQAVEAYHWLQPGEMLDGLGLAESTPGPLIMVVQFVGFLGTYRQPGTLEPMTAAIIGSTLTTWVTFVPCFIWVFLGAPYVERMRGSAALSAALSAITAAVVGVILNMAVWFGVHVLFTRVDDWAIGAVIAIPVPDMASADVRAMALVAIAALAVRRFKSGAIATIVATAATGTLLSQL